MAARTLLSIRRHWLLIVSLVALAVVLAFIGIPVMPRKYSAIASIFPSLYSQEQGKIVALATVDAMSIVNGEARLLLSDAILQAVVSRLGPQQPPEAGQGSGWFRTTFFPGIRTDSPLDREMAMLRSKVEVAKDPRSYLISISFAASCADEAARVASSTIAVEYLRDKWVQRKRDAVIAAEAELTRQLAVNGDKHPKVLLAVEALDVAHADLKAIMAPDEGGQDSVRTDEGVKLALPNRTPTSPRGFVILGLSCTLGLLAGVGLAIWRYRRGLEPFDLAFGRQFIAERRAWPSRRRRHFPREAAFPAHRDAPHVAHPATEVAADHRRSSVALAAQARLHSANSLVHRGRATRQQRHQRCRCGSFASSAKAPASQTKVQMVI